MSRLVLGALAALLVVVFVPGSAGSAALPPPEQLPAGVVVVVSDVPLSLGRVTKAEFHRALAQAAAAAGRGKAPKPGAPGYARLKEQALGERINLIWIEGQAAMMGIDVSDRDVARELARIKEANFKSEREYHAFLRDSRYTQRDVNERVRAQVLATRIQERVARQATGNIAAAFNEFVKEYGKRWKSRTICAPRFVTGDCSNAPGDLA